MLNAIGCHSELLRQLVQLLRVVSVPVVERNLSYWGQSDIRKNPCDIIPLDLVHGVHLHVHALGAESSTAQASRHDFAAFCLSRLQQRKGKDGMPPGPVEPVPSWRVCYMRALESLHVNPEGKGHRTLYWLERNDPDELVRKTAAEVYPVLREGDNLREGDSPRRPFITAIWWLLQGHLRELGIEPDASQIDLTREAFLRRTNERYASY